MVAIHQEDPLKDSSLTPQCGMMEVFKRMVYENLLIWIAAISKNF